MLYREGCFGTYAEDTFGTLKACGGNNGGGSETLIVTNNEAATHDNAPIALHIMQDPITSETVTPCISAGSSNGQAAVGVNVDYAVRRLTPLECERLQGYPDGWTLLPQIDSMSNETYVFWCSVLFEKAKIEGRVRWNADNSVYEIWRETAQADSSDAPKVWVNTEKPYKHKTPAQMLKWYNKMVDADGSDAARYKAIGNSIALPPWEYVLQRLSVCCGEDVTMASLFDGIGGFPLIWERLNGTGACLWASEIEEFPIAVTKQHFSEVGSNEERFL